MEVTVFSFLRGKNLSFQSKNSEFDAYPLCVGYIYQNIITVDNIEFCLNVLVWILLMFCILYDNV